MSGLATRHDREAVAEILFNEIVRARVTARGGGWPGSEADPWMEYAIIENACLRIAHKCGVQDKVRSELLREERGL